MIHQTLLIASKSALTLEGFHLSNLDVIARYEMNVSEQDQILELLKRFHPSGLNVSLGDLRQLAQLAQYLPVQIREFLVDAKFTEKASAYVISAPCLVPPNLASTPKHWGVESIPKSSLHFEAALIIFASILGDVFAWRTQQGGTFVHDVLPVKGLEYEQLGAGSLTPLSWHTEDAFHKFRGDYIGLGCLRNPDKVATTLASIDALKLSEYESSILHDSRFMIVPDNSHLPKHNLSVSKDQFHQIDLSTISPETTPLLFGDAKRPFLRIDPDFMRTIEGDIEAKSALAHIYEAINEALIDIHLLAGDFLFIDNYRCVHGRRAFQPRFDGTDRWLKRVNLSRSLRFSQAAGYCDAQRVMT
jgi:Fe(II)/alpha-ketoglutarate-dependent arginine beta-hydroxylase